MTVFDLLDVPTVSPLRVPTVVERVLPTGLRVLSVRRASTPIVEVFLRVPFSHAEPALAILLAGTLADGLHTQSRLRTIGGRLAAAVDADRLRLTGYVLSDQLPAFLALVSELLTKPAHPEDEFALTVHNAVQSTIATRASSAHQVTQALSTRMFPSHPYGAPALEPEEFTQIDTAAVHALHTERVGPAGACLVMVGDVDPVAALDEAERALGAWLPASRPVPMRKPGPWTPSRSLVNKPGTPQSMLRMAMRIPKHDADDYPALALAVLVFGGHFSSRLVQNLREDKGFSYAPHSSLLHIAEAAVATVYVDVVTASTVPAVDEVFAELDRMTSRQVSPSELDCARRYSAGTLRLRLATLSGLASTLCELDLHRLPIQWLGGHDARLAAVTPEEVTAAAMKYLVPEKAVTVLLCDAARVYPENSDETALFSHDAS